MRTLLALLVLASSAIQSEGLKCHTCVSANVDECNRQGSQSCPQYADACSTITGTNTVMKSCTYKAFCDKAHNSNSGMKMDCCFTEDCNGPHKGKSASHNAGAALFYNPALMFGALLTKLAFSRL